MNKPRDVIIGAVYGWLFLVDGFELYEDTAQDIEKHWSVGPAEAWVLGLRSVPWWNQNLIISERVEKVFGGDVLSQTPGFYSYDRTSTVCNCLFDGFARCVCGLKCWAMDLDPKLATRGVLFPIRNSRGWIVGVKVFRDVKDQRPFPLRVRRAA